MIGILTALIREWVFARRYAHTRRTSTGVCLGETIDKYLNIESHARPAFPVESRRIRFLGEMYGIDELPW